MISHSQEVAARSAQWYLEVMAKPTDKPPGDPLKGPSPPESDFPEEDFDSLFERTGDTSMSPATRDCLLDAAANFAYECDGLVEGTVLLSYTEDCSEFRLKIVPADALELAPGTIEVATPSASFLAGNDSTRKDN